MKPPSEPFFRGPILVIDNTRPIYGNALKLPAPCQHAANAIWGIIDLDSPSKILPSQEAS